MANSVKFDSVELNATPYFPRTAKHESFPERQVGTMQPSREDGDIFMYERFGKKIITMTGHLCGTSQADFESKKDTMSELLSRVEKNLDFDWNGSTRRYVATCSRFELDRDHYNISNCPFIIEFVVSGGVGKDTSITVEKHAVSLNANPYSFTSTFAGSAAPKPVITIEIGAWFTNPMGVMLENVTTGEKIVFNKQTGHLASGDTIVFDFENKKVTLEGVEQKFYGSFPTLIIGANSLKITVAEILDQYTSNIESFAIEYDVYGANLLFAQAFMIPYTDPTYKKVDLYFEKEGTPPNALSFEIQTDDGGKPSGTKVEANAYGSIPEASVGTDPAWISAYLNDHITLQANTRYWIVVKTTNGDASNKYLFPAVAGASAIYPKGGASRTIDGGANWTDKPDENMGMKLSYGGSKDTPLGTVTLDVDYYKRWL